MRLLIIAVFVSLVVGCASVGPDLLTDTNFAGAPIDFGIQTDGVGDAE